MRPLHSTTHDMLIGFIVFLAKRMIRETYSRLHRVRCAYIKMPYFLMFALSPSSVPLFLTHTHTLSLLSLFRLDEDYLK